MSLICHFQQITVQVMHTVLQLITKKNWSVDYMISLNQQKNAI